MPQLTRLPCLQTRSASVALAEQRLRVWRDEQRRIDLRGQSVSLLFWQRCLCGSALSPWLLRLSAPSAPPELPEREAERMHRRLPRIQTPSARLRCSALLPLCLQMQPTAKSRQWRGSCSLSAPCALWTERPTLRHTRRSKRHMRRRPCSAPRWMRCKTTQGR
jgi:hypothetical protein